MFCVVGVVWYTAATANQDNVVDFLKDAKQTCSCIPGADFRTAYITAERW